MGAPTVYRWDDTDAPVVMLGIGYAIELLKACLVDGYGDKPAAGWSLEFDTGVSITERTAAFRNDPVDGTGCYLRVHEDETNILGYGSYTECCGYMTMSDVDTGSDRFPTIESEYASICKAPNQNYEGVPHPWIMIADNRCFYLFVYPNADSRTATEPDIVDVAQYTTTMFFGDFESVIPGDSYACALVGKSGYGTGALVYGQSPSSASANYTYVPRFSAGYPPDNTVTTSLVFSMYNTGPVGAHSGNGFGLNYPFNGQMVISRPYMNDGKNYTMRGYLPGYYMPCHADLLWSDSVVTEVTQDDMTFLGIPHGICYVGSYTYKSQSLIRIDEGFRA
ncbi:hypothetical protein [Desulfogranum japonicum]|uniref:hypothetical protein n=1 Tax=Desulfogranum japonicum TaxID=231447 RepID=UPI0003F6FC17|nr:hypothetical protein [Desulfogranum japonicum]